MGWNLQEEPRLQSPLEFTRAQTRLGWQRPSGDLLFGTSSGGNALPSYGQNGLSTPKPDFGWMNKPLKRPSGTQWSWSRSGMTLAPAAAGQSYLSVDASPAYRGSASTPSLGLDSRFDDFESWGRKHNRERGEVAPPDPWLTMNGHRYETYGAAVGATLRGEGRALNPVRAYEGFRNAVTYIAEDNNWYVALGEVADGMIQGMMFWNQESLEDWGESVMADILSFSPELKQAPNSSRYGLRDPRLLPNTGGATLFAITERGKGQPVFRIDWHRLPEDRLAVDPWARGRSLPHYHYGETSKLRGIHRPWEQPPRTTSVRERL